MAKEFQAVHSKDAFGRVDDKAKFLQAIEQNADVLFVFVRCGTGHQKTVKEGKDKRKSSSDFVYESLERHSSVLQAERYTGVLKQSERGIDCHFRYVCRLHRNSVMSFHQVNLAVAGRTSKTF